MASYAPSVLIVGAGPVGLVLAVDLARRGIPIRIIDTLAAPTLESRALVVHARSLEMMEALGVARELIASGVQSTALEFHADGRLLAHIQLQGLDSRFKFALSTPQPETERVLTERLAALGVTVDRGVTLVGLDQDDTGVRVRLVHANGLEEIVRTPWLVGTDGSRSTTRALIGERLLGTLQGETFLAGDVEATFPFDASTMHMFLFPEDGPILLFPTVGDRARVFAEIRDPEEKQRAPSSEWLQEVIARRHLKIAIADAHWVTTFETRHAQVRRYRVGRVFLAGDAAHVHSPAGGQGMNTGMQDAFNLGWKLALAATSDVRDALLDSYHAERHPIAARVIEMTTDVARVGTTESRYLRDLRNVFLHFASRFSFAQHRVG